MWLADDIRCVQPRDRGLPLGGKMSSEPGPTGDVDEAGTLSNT
jgi:hypothetical protein